MNEFYEIDTFQVNFKLNFYSKLINERIKNDRSYENKPGKKIIIKIKYNHETNGH